MVDTSIDNGNVQREIYRHLKKIGYRLEHVVLNASEYGIPQKRERVYFVAMREDSPLYFIPPQPSNQNKYLKDILLPDSKTAWMAIERDDVNFDQSHRMRESGNYPIRIGHVNKCGQGERIYSVNGHAITLSANGGGVGNRTPGAPGGFEKAHGDQQEI